MGVHCDEFSLECSGNSKLKTDPFQHSPVSGRNCDVRCPPSWLNDYLMHAYEPKAADFRRLRGYVSKQR